MLQVDCNDSKTTWISLWIASAPTLFSRSAPQQLLAAITADLKRMRLKERFGSNVEMISETEAYFEVKDKSFYKKGNELLEKH